MKRVFSLIAILIIAFILMSDLSLITKYYHKPNAYAAMEKVSFLHFFLLSEWGIQFAYFKATISTLLLTLWSWKLIYPSKVSMLRYATSLYALVWALIGMLLLTGIVGVLQYSAGLTIKLYDFSPLLIGMGLSKLAMFSLSVVILPLALMLVPILHNRFNQCC